MLLSLPLLLIPVIAYNVLAFSTGITWSYEVLALDMVSGARWVLSLADLFLALTLVLLFVEILKSTRTGTVSLVDHILSTGLFVICLIEFLLLPAAATSVFFLMTVITLIDVVAGFSVTIAAARRDFSVDR
jgi:hypothetical protein